MTKELEDKINNLIIGLGGSSLFASKKRLIKEFLDEYAKQECELLIKALEEVTAGQHGELKGDFIGRIRKVAEKAIANHKNKT